MENDWEIFDEYEWVNTWFTPLRKLNDFVNTVIWIFWTIIMLYTFHLFWCTKEMNFLGYYVFLYSLNAQAIGLAFFDDYLYFSAERKRHEERRVRIEKLRLNDHMYAVKVRTEELIAKLRLYPNIAKYVNAEKKKRPFSFYQILALLELEKMKAAEQKKKKEQLKFLRETSELRMKDLLLKLDEGYQLSKEDLKFLCKMCKIGLKELEIEKRNYEFKLKDLRVILKKQRKYQLSMEDIEYIMEKYDLTLEDLKFTEQKYKFRLEGLKWVKEMYDGKRFLQQQCKLELEELRVRLEEKGIQLSLAELSVILALYAYGVEELAILLKECKEKLEELRALRERKSELSTEYFETIKQEYQITLKECDQLSLALNLASEDQSIYKCTLEDLKFMEKEFEFELEQLKLLLKQQDGQLTTEEVGLVMEEYEVLLKDLKLVQQEIKFAHYKSE